MATNPNNALGTNGAFGGRTSPNAFNDVLALFQSRGILSGFAISPDSGMTISIGGNGETRDVAVAEDNAGNKTTVNNIAGSPASLTIEAAPAINSRIDAIVAYVTNPPEGGATAVDNYGAVGLLDVQGTTSSSPTAPDDSDIRSAITADGESGATAYYVVLGYITVASGTTDITADMISAGSTAVLDGGSHIAPNSIMADNVDCETYDITDQVQSTGVLSDFDCYSATVTVFAGIRILDILVRTQNDTFGTTSTGSQPDPQFTIPQEYAPSMRIISQCGVVNNYSYPMWNPNHDTSRAAYLAIDTNGEILVRAEPTYPANVAQIHLVYK